MSRDEFEELLYYVVELKDKLNAKLDEQCAKINHQGSIINQQGQIVDELCWQLRELSEKVRDQREENRRLKERLGQFCTRCRECRCDSESYENHVADRYNELTIDRKKSKVVEVKVGEALRTAGSEIDSNSSSLKPDEDQQIQQQKVESTEQINRSSPDKKVDEYSQVVKQSTKKKWLFGGKAAEPSSTSHETITSNTTWYVDDESIYEPIELSAKPTTRAQLEKISAEVSTQVVSVPKPAPRRLYTAAAVDNLAKYFEDSGNALNNTDEDDEDSDIMLRPSRFKQFNSESQRGSSKVACSRIADLDLSYLPEEESISSENIVRFTINSRPATALPTTKNNTSNGAPDSRRHAIRSYM